MYDYVWLCMTLYDYVWLRMTMYDYLWLYMTIYNFVWFFYASVWPPMPMTLYHSIFLCITLYMTINDSERLLMIRYDYKWLLMSFCEHHWLYTVNANLKVVHIGPKHVHIGHILVQITPKDGGGLAVTLDKNFDFSKVLLPPKFNNNSIIIELKKKILCYIVSYFGSGILTLSKARLNM